MCVDASETTSGYGRFANSDQGSGKGTNAEYDLEVKMSKPRKGKKRRKILGANIVATKPLKRGAG